MGLASKMKIREQLSNFISLEQFEGLVMLNGELIEEIVDSHGNVVEKNSVEEFTSRDFFEWKNDNSSIRLYIYSSGVRMVQIYQEEKIYEFKYLLGHFDHGSESYTVHKMGTYYGGTKVFLNGYFIGAFDVEVRNIKSKIRLKQIRGVDLKIEI